MKIPFSPFSVRFLCTAATMLRLGSTPLQAQAETPEAAPIPPQAAPVPSATAPAADAPPEAVPSAVEEWLLDPASAPLPSHADFEKYLAGLKQRQDDLSKTIEFLVSKKRLRQEAWEKESSTAAVPADLSIEHWDELAALSGPDAAKVTAAFAEKVRTVNLAQQTESLKLSKLMLRREDEGEAVRHHPHAAASPTPAPVVATPIPEHGRRTGAGNGVFGISKSAAAPSATPPVKGGKSGN